MRSSDRLPHSHGISTHDAAVLASFEACRMTTECFDHRTHLQVAYALIVQVGVEQAAVRMKTGLLRLLKHLGAGEDKYHETLTRGWILAVHHFMSKVPGCPGFDKFIVRASPLLDQSLMNTHYSAELLATPEARHKFVMPNLAPIPLHQT